MCYILLISTSQCFFRIFQNFQVPLNSKLKLTITSQEICSILISIVSSWNKIISNCDGWKKPLYWLLRNFFEKLFWDVSRIDFIGFVIRKCLPSGLFLEIGSTNFLISIWKPDIRLKSKNIIKTQSLSYFLH